MKYKLIKTSTIDTSLYILLRGQLSFLNKYYEVVGVSSSTGNLNEISKREGIKIKEVKMNREISLINDFCSLIQLYKLFKQEKPFIVHSITPKAGLLSMIAAFFAGVPHRIHTFTGLVFPSKKGIFRFILLNMDRITCLFATKIIPEGEGVKRDLIKYGITHKSINVIGNGNVNGIDLAYFDNTSFDKLKSRQEIIGINKEDFVFIFIGRLVKDKGLEELIKAFIKISDNYSSVKLLLVGPFEDELDPISVNTRNTLFENHNIISVGFQDDVRPYLSASDVLTFPSYREGFPNVVIQAGAMGLPSIVTDINGCNEIIEDGVNGIIIPPKDSESLYNAMVELYQNKQKREKMAAIAREMISSRYDQQLVWDALLKEYQSLENDI